MLTNAFKEAITDDLQCEIYGINMNNEPQHSATWLIPNFGDFHSSLRWPV